ncbi:MAG TPA: aminomethyltransferase family protein [Methylomirabilota bacterium]|nr:aminomethyltransferase family protein [Methylomirabilota bacterium]
MPNGLALAEVHRAAGGVIEEVCGWQLPRHYGDPAREYRAVREGAGLIDRSMLGKVVVTGRDRLAFLQGMLTNDVGSLQPGQGTAAAFLDAHGKVHALLSVYALEDRVWLELPASLTEKTLQTLDRYLISEKAYFESADDAFVVLALQGPGAVDLLAGVCGRSPELAPYAHAEVTIAGTPVRVIHRREAGLPGVHCWTAAGHGGALWEALLKAGAQPVGVDTLNVLRVEAGVAWYGHDVDESVILPEAQLEHLVSYTKGCYIGQEVVARVKYRGHINRGLVGLVLEGDRVPGFNARVAADGKEVGRITSAVRSPAVGKPIALGYVRREHFEPGSAVTVEDGDRPLQARVSALPFIPAA